MKKEDSTIKTKEEIFVEFHYQEVKDLSKHFLTLISATLVLSVTFADKIIGFEAVQNVQKWLLGSCWLTLLTSLLLTGLGIYNNYMAAEKAKGDIIYDYSGDFRVIARRAYTFLDLAAVFYGLSLLLLAAVSASRFFQ